MEFALLEIWLKDTIFIGVYCQMWTLSLVTNLNGHQAATKLENMSYVEDSIVTMTTNIALVSSANNATLIHIGGKVANCVLKKRMPCVGTQIGVSYFFFCFCEKTNCNIIKSIRIQL